MKKLLIIIVFMACSFIGKSQVFLGHTMDSLVAMHYGLEGQWKVVIDNASQDSVLLIQTNWYVLIANINKKSHVCHNYTIVIQAPDVARLYDSLIIAKSIPNGKNKWLSMNEKISVEKKGYGPAYVNNLYVIGEVYEVAFTVDAYLPERKDLYKKRNK